MCPFHMCCICSCHKLQRNGHLVTALVWSNDYSYLVVCNDVLVSYQVSFEMNYPNLYNGVTVSSEVYMRLHYVTVGTVKNV